MMVDTI